MKKIIAELLVISMVTGIASPVYAKKNTPHTSQTDVYPGEDGYTDAQTINHNITTKIYSVKKTKSYTAVEIGFTNNTDKYVEFSPKEIFLNDSTSYSQTPLDNEAMITAITKHKSSARLIPLALGIGLGIAALATSRSSSDASFGLSVAALSAGGLYILSEALANQLQNNKLVAIENNRIDDIKKLPPGITLGGFMYFPATKNPESITIVARTKSGSYEKHVFDLTKVKESRKFDKKKAKQKAGTRE